MRNKLPSHPISSLDSCLLLCVCLPFSPSSLCTSLAFACNHEYPFHVPPPILALFLAVKPPSRLESNSSSPSSDSASSTEK